MMEISVKDLKIGDYFSNPLGAIGRIDDIRHVFSRDKDGNIEDDCYRVKLAYDEHGESYCWLDIEDLRPIPITPKILEKNGFVDAGFFGRLELNGFVVICDTQNLTILRDGHCDLEIPVRFVHELQQALRTCKVDLDIVL